MHAASLPDGLGWGTQWYILFISTQSLLLLILGICSRDAYHCQCHRHVQEGSISQHHSNFSGIQYFQDIDTILMIADHPAFTKKMLEIQGIKNARK